MKSKVFVTSSSWLDEELAEWLKSESPAKIESMTQSSSNGTTVILTIIYW